MGIYNGLGKKNMYIKQKWKKHICEVFELPSIP